MSHVTTATNSSRYNLAFELFGIPHQTIKRDNREIALWIVDNEDNEAFQELCKESVA